NACDPVSMPLESEEFPALCGVPHLHRLAPTADDAFAVRSDGSAQNPASVPPKGALSAIKKREEVAILTAAGLSSRGVHMLPCSWQVVTFPLALGGADLGGILQPLRPR